MNTWLDLALMEWRRSFRLRQIGAGAGRRDLFWLTVLLFLTLTLALLLWGTRQGLVNQFMNVSLGYIEGSGVPLWLVSEVGGLEDNLIDRQVVERMDALGIPDLAVYPYRELEPHEVALSGFWADKEVWKKGESFIGWAVEIYDPLWRFNSASVPPASVDPAEHLKLEVVANQTLFLRNFDCSAYLVAVAGRVPVPALEEKEAEVGGIPSCLADGTLWLDLMIGRERSLVPFSIRWLKTIPTMQQVALLMPAGVLHAVKISRHNPDYRYNPEDPEGAEAFIRDVLVMLDSDHENPDRLNLLKECLGAVKSADARQIHLKSAISNRRLEACASRSKFKIKRQAGLVEPPYLKISGTMNGDRVLYDEEGYLTVNCSGLNPFFRSRIEDCLERGATGGRIHATDLLNGYPRAMAYVPRSHLFRAKEALTALPKYAGDTAPDAVRAVYIHDSYEDALVRFSFINEVMEQLGSFYGFFFVLFLTVLLWGQIGFVISHRRHLYGVYLAKGLSWNEAFRILVTQIALSFLVGLGGAVAVLSLMSLSLRLAVLEILQSEAFSERISSDLNLLPVSGVDLFLLAALALSLSCFIAWILFRLILFRLVGSASRVEPADLLQT